MKIYIVSDIHLVAPGETSKGLDTSARLQWALDDLKTNHADADLCVLLGDLADHGEKAAYEQLQAQLADLPVKVVPMIGNHDDRATFLSVFKTAAVDDKGFVQSVVDCEEGRLIFLDTVEPGYASGHLCEDRLDWLADRLEEVEDTPVYIFMHHPPFNIGTRVDGLKMMDGEGFVDVLSSHEDVRHIAAGHTHRVCSGGWLGIPFTNLGASTYNTGVHLNGAPGWGKRYAQDVFAGIMLIDDEQVVVHAHNVNPTIEPMAAGLFPEARVDEIVARGGRLAAE